MIKIHKGTQASGFHLCDKCTFNKSRTHEDGYVERQCTASDNEASHWAVVKNSRVVECSMFQTGGTDLRNMYSTAWMWHKDDDGDITFVDQNARQNPQMFTKYPSRWRRFVWWYRKMIR